MNINKLAPRFLAAAAGVTAAVVIGLPLDNAPAAEMTASNANTSSAAAGSNVKLAAFTAPLPDYFYLWQCIKIAVPPSGMTQRCDWYRYCGDLPERYQNLPRYAPPNRFVDRCPG